MLHSLPSQTRHQFDKSFGYDAPYIARTTKPSNLAITCVPVFTNLSESGTACCRLIPINLMIDRHAIDIATAALVPGN
jgi:hypothetical protein